MKQQNFEFNSKKIRVIIDEQFRPWFVAKDVAEALGYAKPANAIKAHCKNVRSCFLKSKGQFRRFLIITESDLYRLTTGTRFPTADRFEKWVDDEVMPSIRKTITINVNKEKVMAEILANPRRAAKMILEHLELQEKSRLKGQ